MAFHLIQNPTIRVKLLTSAWGGGKTLIALSYALEQIHNGKFQKLIFVRNNIIVADTNDIGFLPGDQAEKMLIWGMPLADHLGGEDVLKQLIDEGIIEIYPLSHIRGRSLHSSIIICDECENMNDKLVELQEQVGSEKMTLVQADLTKEEDIIQFIGEVRTICDCPSHIVHFPAPVCNNSKFHKIKWEVFQREYDISLKSAVLILQAFLPGMAKAHYGRVLFMLSYVVNNVAPAYCSNYVVTKYALLGLMKSLATEYASKGITVNGISPAWVNTRYIDNQPDMLKEQNAASSPLGRNLEVDDIVPAMEFLLSDGASCVNGENLTISCGR